MEINVQAFLYLAARNTVVNGNEATDFGLIELFLVVGDARL